MTPEEFRQALAARGVELSDHQMQQFADYYEYLVAVNEHVNLTAITQKDEVYLKHFYDSLIPALTVKDLQTEALTLCDVGAGAGFPSIPMKIAFPNLKVTIVDSLNKRIRFLNDLSERLGLEEVEFHHGRAEEFAGKKSRHRESYDVVTARAVARLSVLSEYCLPLARVGGRFIALVDDAVFHLPETDDVRHIITIEKIRQTPKKYPRKAGTPAKMPLEKPRA